MGTVLFSLMTILHVLYCMSVKREIWNLTHAGNHGKLIMVVYSGNMQVAWQHLKDEKKKAIVNNIFIA